MTELRKLYFNPRFSGSFSGLSTFIKNRKLGKAKSVIEDELLRNPAYYFYRPANKKIKHRQRVLVHLPNFQLVADLIDMQRFAKENSNFRYILIAIDAFSRKMYCVPIKDKKGETLVRVIKKIFKEIPRIVRYFQTDAGTEFTNKLVQDYFKSKEIIWFSTYSSIKVDLFFGCVIRKSVINFAYPGQSSGKSHFNFNDSNE